MKNSKKYMREYMRTYKREEMKIKRKEYYNKNKTYFLLKAKKWRAKNKEKSLEYHRKSQKKTYKENPLKFNARNKARIIKIPTGQMCEGCKKNLAVEKHHEDYNKPLKIKFLCLKCHNKQLEGLK